MAFGKMISSAVKKAGLKAERQEKPSVIGGSSVLTGVGTVRPSNAPIRGRARGAIGKALEEYMKQRGMKKGGAVKKAASKKKK